MDHSQAFMSSDWVTKNNITNPIYLAGGSFSTVYSFLDPEDKTEKTLRVIEKREGDDLGDWIDEANKELQALRCLKECPHVLDLERYHIDINKGFIFLVTQRAQKSLAKLIGERGKLDNLLLTKLLRTLLEGLSFAHKLKIAHGNLNPDNILVTASEDFLIADWGMMKAKGIQLEKLQAAGAEAYLPPECRNDVKGDKINFFKADVYSLALVCLAAIGVSEKEIVKAVNILKREEHDRNVADLLQSNLSDQSQGLLELLKKMCVFDPNEWCDIFKAQELFSQLLPKAPQESSLSSLWTKEAPAELLTNFLESLDYLTKENVAKLSDKSDSKVELNLIGLKQLDDELLLSILKPVKEKDDLEHFDIKLIFANITEATGDTLAELLAETKEVETVNLSFCGTCFGLALTKTVKQLGKLKQFGLAFSPQMNLSNSVLAAWSETIGQLENLACLGLSFRQHHNLSVEGVLKLLGAIGALINLEKLTFLFEQVKTFSDEEALLLVKALKGMKKLNSLSVDLSETAVTAELKEEMRNSLKNCEETDIN